MPRSLGESIAPARGGPAYHNALVIDYYS
jgi:hypothetical protein